MITINKRISAIIENLGIKKIEFARRLKLSAPYVSEMCSGKTTPSDRTIADICREFNVNEIWLRTGEGEPFQKLTRKESIAGFMGDVLASEPDDIRLRVVDILSRLTAEDWEFIEKRLLRLAAEVQEEHDK